MDGECPLVIIRWQDSKQTCGKWRFLSALPEFKSVECATVGWLLKDSNDVKVISQSIGDITNEDNAQASGIMVIAASSVISIEKLVEEDKPTSSSLASPCRELESPQSPPSF